MDNKKFEGTLTLDDFIDQLTAYNRCKSLGTVWERCVMCDNCPHTVACEALNAQFPEIKCRQVIDILIGDLKIEEVK